MLFVLRIGESFEVIGKSPRSTDIFWWAGPLCVSFRPTFSPDWICFFEMELASLWLVEEIILPRLKHSR